VVYAKIQGDPNAIMSSFRDRVRSVDPNLLVTGMRTMDAQLNLRLANERVLAFLSIGFAVLAAILALTGLYGVLTFVVARRNREIGIRLALGAQPGSVIQLVLTEMAVVILAGIAIGVIASGYLGRYVETQLYGVQPFDPGVFTVSAAMLAACALSAAFLPAWKASRLDPMAALRQD
jgi:ABC-type antimicrobial peptide transport system permease subunit